MVPTPNAEKKQDFSATERVLAFARSELDRDSSR
jgi:hypothetical protein